MYTVAFERFSAVLSCHHHDHTSTLWRRCIRRNGGDILIVISFRHPFVYLIKINWPHITWAKTLKLVIVAENWYPRCWHTFLFSMTSALPLSAWVVHALFLGAILFSKHFLRDLIYRVKLVPVFALLNQEWDRASSQRKHAQLGCELPWIVHPQFHD